MAPPGCSQPGKCELIKVGGVRICQERPLLGPSSQTPPPGAPAAPHKSYHSRRALEGLALEQGDGERKPDFQTRADGAAFFFFFFFFGLGVGRWWPCPQPRVWLQCEAFKPCQPHLQQLYLPGPQENRPGLLLGRRKMS